MAQQRRGVIVPGAFNALSARLVESVGYEAVYLSGAGLSNMSLGLPDLGFVGLSDLAEHTSRMRDAVNIPIIVDADTGFGNALNVRHTVRTLERCGADAIQFEDQVAPKRCGHFVGQQLISTQEAMGKIQSAVDARHDPDLMIVARTDAVASLGIEAAVERAHRYAEAGADVLFIEAVPSIQLIEMLPMRFDKPLLLNLVLGGRTPSVQAETLARFGYGFVLYANAALQSALTGMQRALVSLKHQGILDEDPFLVTPFSERQQLVDKPLWDAIATKFGPAGDGDPTD